jgi:hypothetical protein
VREPPSHFNTHAASFFHGSRLVERQEQILVQALVTKPAVEVGPQIQVPRDKLRAIVDPNRLLLTTLYRRLFQDPHDIVSGQTLADLDGQALTTMVIDSHQQPEPLLDSRGLTVGTVGTGERLEFSPTFVEGGTSMLEDGRARGRSARTESSASTSRRESTRFRACGTP